MSDKLAHICEQVAGRLLVRAFKLRMRAGNEHECAHIYESVKAGDTERCNPAHCRTLRAYRAEFKLRQGLGVEAPNV